jgi:hypothetical protein
MILADDILERLRSPLAGNDLISGRHVALAQIRNFQSQIQK